MDHFNYFKDLYQKEIDRKNEISSSISISIGLLPAIIGALFYLISTFDFRLNILSSIYILSCVIATTLLFVAGYHFIKLFSGFTKGHTYAYIQNSDILLNYSDSLLEYHNNAAEANAEFKQYLLTEYVNATAINQIENDDKTKHRYLCHKYIAFTIISMVFVLGTYGTCNILQKKKAEVHNVKLTNFGKEQFNHIIMSTDQEEGKGKEKPVPPPLKLIMEGRDATVVNLKTRALAFSQESAPTAKKQTTSSQKPTGTIPKKKEGE